MQLVLALYNSIRRCPRRGTSRKRERGSRGKGSPLSVCHILRDCGSSLTRRRLKLATFFAAWHKNSALHFESRNRRRRRRGEARREEARRGRYKSNLTTTFGYVSKDRVKARTGRQLERGEREGERDRERGAARGQRTRTVTTMAIISTRFLIKFKLAKSQVAPRRR